MRFDFGLMRKEADLVGYLGIERAEMDHGYDGIVGGHPTILAK